MTRPDRLRCTFVRALPLLLLAVLLACGAPVGTPGVDAGQQAVGSLVADFSLPDVNPASPRAGATVSPRDYAGVVTGWYFGHST